VNIVGPRQLFVDFRADSVAQNYRITTEDLRGDLVAQWTADGTVSSPAQYSTSVRFNTAGNSPGSVLRRAVRVTVTDTDALSATREIDVEIRVTDLSDSTIPPECRVKPWLPQCNLV
jgi:hypothetical protein